MMGWCPNDGEECRHDGWCNDCEHADAKIKQIAIKARESLIAQFEEILADIRESNVDESVCGMCEYDGAYMGASGDWCNECPGFDRDDCFKLSDDVKKRWLGLTKEGGERMTINKDDFGTLAICAIRYCQGRQTYMPDLVHGIIRGRLAEVSNKDLQIMIDDCDFQERCDLYGDERIDKPGWLKWKADLMKENERRTDG